MSKKEKAEFDAALYKAKILGALRWTTGVEPDVMPPVSGISQLRAGYLYNKYGDGEIRDACTSTIYHSYGRNDKTTTQGSRALYSTRLLAAQALRHELELDAAKKLAKCDALIESLTTSDQPE